MARLFCDPGATVSQKAAAPEVAHQARAAKELVRTPGSAGLPPIPSNTGRGLPSTCSSTGDGAHCCRGGWVPCVLFFLGGG